MATYIIRKNIKNEYYWVLRSNKNYETVAMSSESYVTKQGVNHSIAWTQENGETALIVDDSDKDK